VNCQQAARTVLKWYAKTYTSLPITDAKRIELGKSLELLSSVPLRDIVVPEDQTAFESLETEHVIVLHGEPWVGKTSLACVLASQYVQRGFIPIIFQQRSLVDPRILSLYRMTGDREEESVSLNHIAVYLNEYLSTQLLLGEGFVLLLDDSFGHRRQLSSNPLERLRLNAWLELTRQPNSLGRIKVIITSPSRFLYGAINTSRVDRSPLLAENLGLLRESRCHELKLADFRPSEILRIIRTTARSLECRWSDRQSVSELVAEKIGSSTFEGLRSFCVSTRIDDDDIIIQKLSHFDKFSEFRSSIESLSPDAQRLLCAVYVAESFVELKTEFQFQSDVDAKQLCEAAGVPGVSSLSKLFSVEGFDEFLARWVVDDKVFTLDRSALPTFRHPEVRVAVHDWVQKEGSGTVLRIINNLCRGSEGKSAIISRWESVHMWCRFARFLDDDARQYVDNEEFHRKSGGLDPRNLVWAILENWDYLRDSQLEQAAKGYIKHCIDVVHNTRRLLIWEIAEHWRGLDETLRAYPHQLNSKLTDQGTVPNFNVHHSLAFLASTFANYDSIASSARSGSTASERHLNLVQSFIMQLKSGLDTANFESRLGDGLFNALTIKFTGEKVLSALVQLGCRRGAVNRETDIVQQIQTILERKKN
jgi:hypothetical protein